MLILNNYISLHDVIMAAAPNGIIIKAPQFHGITEAQAKTGSSAEDFIGQIENLIGTQAWTNEQAAGHAISYLNGSARTWFFDALKMVEPANRLAALTSFVAFRALFVRYFFAIRTTFDLSVDWTGLKQKDRENIQTFGLRVAASMSKYFELFPMPAPRPARLVEVNEAIHNLFLDFPVDLRQAAIAAHRPGLAALFTRVQLDGAQDGFKGMVDDIILKLLSEGVRDEKMRELIRRHHKMQTPIAALFPLMSDLENAGQRKKDASSAVAVPKLLAISATPDNPLSVDEIALLNEHRRKNGATASAGRGGGGGNARGGRGRGGGGRGGGPPGGGAAAPTPQQPPAQGRSTFPPAPDSAYWTKVCSYCNKYGHLQDICFKKEKDGKRTNAAHPDQVGYLGDQRAENEMGWM